MRPEQDIDWTSAVRSNQGGRSASGYTMGAVRHVLEYEPAVDTSWSADVLKEAIQRLMPRR